MLPVVWMAYEVDVTGTDRTVYVVVLVVVVVPPGMVVTHCVTPGDTSRGLSFF